MLDTVQEGLLRNTVVSLNSTHRFSIVSFNPYLCSVRCTWTECFALETLHGKLDIAWRNGWLHVENWESWLLHFPSGMYH